MKALREKVEFAVESGLTGNVDNEGHATIWGSERRKRLTWSFQGGPASFSDHAEDISAAFGSWMSACGVNFIYLASGGFINVRWATTDEEEDPELQGVIAMAFFPFDSPRDVVLFQRFRTYGNNVGVLRHELGHVLGFRHEHIWFPKSPAERQTHEPIGIVKKITAHDPDSIMNYNRMWADTAAGRMSDLSPLDKVGSRLMYGAPFGELHFLNA